MREEVRRSLLIIAAPSGWTCKRCNVRWPKLRHVGFGSGMSGKCPGCGGRTQLISPLLCAYMCSDKDLLSRVLCVAVVADVGPCELGNDRWAAHAYFRELIASMTNEEAKSSLGLNFTPQDPWVRKKEGQHGRQVESSG
jgi:hypothetical protein